ncbi:uncharacterized protein [Littorina saxatilis]|uniref:uncharacterized protein n=1 Tax=Littorina saxatilis TaxID=31220 RepID=UPI0038B5A865
MLQIHTLPVYSHNSVPLHPHLGHPGKRLRGGRGLPEPQPGLVLPHGRRSHRHPFFNFLLRFKYINDAHNTSYSCECCLSRHPARTKPERKAPHDQESQFSRGSANGRSSLPPATIRVDSERVVMGEQGAGSKLPPLPGGRRNSRSSDSGMDSRDMSRDSTLDESALASGLASGPLPLSAEMIRRHDRRWHSKKRLEDRQHRRPAFSSTTSLSSTDSQSSAELAPRVHTPTNLKRVHYNIPKEPPAHSGDGAHSAPQPASYEDVLAAGKDGEACTVAPMISFSIKLQGVELSRASTNSRDTATIDNIKLASAAVRKWQRAARRLSRQSLGEVAEVAEAEKNEKKKKSKEKKKKKKKEKKKGETPKELTQKMILLT